MGIFDEEQIDQGAACTSCSALETEVIARVWNTAGRDDEVDADGAYWDFDEGSVILIFPFVDTWSSIGERVSESEDAGETVAAFSDGVLFDFPVREWSHLESHTVEASSVPERDIEFFGDAFGLMLLQRVYGSLTESDAEARREYAQAREEIELSSPEWVADYFGQQPQVLN